MALAIPDSVYHEIDHWANHQTTAVSLRELYEFARGGDDSTIIKAAQFLQNEMPIRLAKKVVELENIPGGLSQTRWMKVVRDWYVQSFMEFIEFPPVETLEQDKEFCQVISTIKDRHRNQVAVMARGLQEFINKEDLNDIPPDVQNFLDSFYLSRIGIRVLLGHHAAIHDSRDGWVGIICAQTDVMDVVKEAVENASMLCRRTYGDPPAVVFHGKTNLRFKYIPSHLHHMIYELMKNSFRASIENAEANGKDKCSRVHVVIAGGMEDVSIKISDAGGGIPRSAIDRVWHYSYTTARKSHIDGSDGDIMAGLGYGLPLCRLYARYFGGDLQLVSLEGFGTDAFLHLSRIGTHGEYIL